MRKRSSPARKREAETAKFLAQKPRLQAGGTVFCSPWCGCNCKKADHDRAHVEGARLSNKMGKGWTYQVWENGGWHFKLVKGKVEIYPGHGGTFSCFLQTTPQFVSKQHKKPRDALREIVTLVYDTVDTLNKAVGRVSGDAL